jgi:glycosyltransferase involved in cell wall biosynthesis
VAIRAGLVRGPDLAGAVNHVWNWGLYGPAGSPASITVPDLLPLEYPQWYGARFRRLTRASLRFARERARYVFAISEYVRGRLAQDAGIDAARVRVVYPGIDPVYFEPQDAPRRRALLQSHGLQEGRYLLSSGFLDPRKNLARQLQAFDLATRGGDGDVKYALTGLENAQSGALLAQLREPALRARVVFLGYVPLADLRLLMAGSAALMYCSIAEGFGLPILEAMACGALVLTSAGSSMRELGEGRALLVDPLQVEDIAAKVRSVLGAGRAACLERVPQNRAWAQGFTVRNWLLGHLEAYAGGGPA